MISKRNTAVAAVAAVLLAGAASVAEAQNQGSFRNLPISASRPAPTKRVKSVGERMAAEMLDRMQRFKGASRDSALMMLMRQSRYHMIVLSQCDFELHLSRLNASTAWQALSDSVARDTRRIVVENQRLKNDEINEVLNRAARMAQFCMNVPSDW